MHYNHLIDRIKEELPGQTIWMQSATDTEVNDEHAEGLAVTMTPSMYDRNPGGNPEGNPEEETTFTVIYFRVYPVYEDGDSLPVDCEVETGYENSRTDLEAAKAEAISLLKHMPRSAILDGLKDPNVFLKTLQELEAP